MKTKPCFQQDQMLNKCLEFLGFGVFGGIQFETVGMFLESSMVKIKTGGDFCTAIFYDICEVFWLCWDFFYQSQQVSEYQTSLIFEWSKHVRLSNGLVFKWWSE